MTKIAVILTVFNRREVTLKGLRSLYKAIDYLGGDNQFDVYMTDDGCTDGTSEAIENEFPTIHVIQGNGNLFWSGGMRMAWQVAIESKNKYDYYLWYNDDAFLFENALKVMFSSIQKAGNNAIISGAFCDLKGNASYGGRNKEMEIMSPCGKLQEIYLMNGNLVLIPGNVEKSVGIIDETFKHSMGDWDYGLRSLKKGFKIYLSAQYVGKTDRHDDILAPFMNGNYSLYDRLRSLYSAKYSVLVYYRFKKRHFGLMQGIRIFLLHHIYAFFPSIKENLERRKKDN